jgi:hypothetical protein
MSLSGPPEVLAKLERLRPDERVQITGFFRFGQRLFSLSAIEPVKRK